uniref:Uncharacterized protein n=1 Tax=Phlebotomus papatasi TaxID=29031 RepID=A0A1B0D9D7_PHLPP
MISEDDKDGSARQNAQESGQTTKICVRKIPGLIANPISVVVSGASTAKQPGDAPSLPTTTMPGRTITKSLLTVKTGGESLGEWFSQNKNIFMKDGNLFMKCANSNKIVKLQVAKAVPASSAQGSEFKLLPVSVKNLPKDIKIAPKPQTTEAASPSPGTTLQVFKPIAKAPLTDAPTIPAKPQPEATQASPKTDKAEVRSIQITNLPTGTILDFKGPAFGINSRFPSLQDPSKESPDSRGFNIQISNGRLSDPDGPIKMLGLAGKSLSVTRKSITINSDGTISSENSLKEAKDLLVDEKVAKNEKTPRKVARSSSTDETPKKTPTPRRLSEPLKPTGPIQETPKPQEKATFESLLCDESLENSSDSEKIEKSPVQEHPNGLLDPLEASDGDPDRNERGFDERSLTQRNANCQLMKLTARREGEDEDPLNLIRWEDGIGYLYGSNLHFQFNELGLVDIMDDDEFMRYQQTESHYDQPICDRELNPLRVRQLQTATEPIYTCLSCSCSGLAADFLAPDYCSKACINISKRRSCTETEEDGKSSSTKRKSKDNSVFPWKYYLASTNSQRAPDELFPHCNSDILDYYTKHPFRPQTKLEAIDPDNCS